MHHDYVLSSQEITDIVDDLTRLFVHDVYTASIVLTITYKSLMTLKKGYIEEIRNNFLKRGEFADSICAQIEMCLPEDKDPSIKGPSLS